MTLEEISRTIGAAGLLLNGQGSREKESLFTNIHIEYFGNRCNIKFQDAVARPVYAGVPLLQCNSTAQSSRRAGKNLHANVCSILSSQTFLVVRTERPRTISSVDDLPAISSVVPILARLTATRSNLRLEARTDSLCLGSVIIRLVGYDFSSGHLI